MELKARGHVVREETRELGRERPCRVLLATDRFCLYCRSTGWLWWLLSKEMVFLEM